MIEKEQYLVKIEGGDYGVTNFECYNSKVIVYKKNKRSLIQAALLKKIRVINNDLLLSDYSTFVKSQSDGLRERITGKLISQNSDGQSKLLKSVIRHKLRDLNNEYNHKGISFDYDSKLSKDDIDDYFKYQLKVQGSKFDFDKLTSSKMRPDGGIVWMYIGKNKYPILMSEMKKQGTNDVRELEGKTKQAMGNAIERFAKNKDFFELLCSFYNILPIALFASGDDFKTGSSIVGRLSVINNMFPLNTDVITSETMTSGLYKTSTTKTRCAIYRKEEKWSYNEIANVITSVTNQAIQYYIELDESIH